MPLVSLSGRTVAEEKGCSCDISSQRLLDLAIATVSIALVGERGKKTPNLLRMYLHVFL